MEPPTIEAKNIKFVPIEDLNLDPKNRNKHPKEQIERLKKLITNLGFRQPLVVSNQTGVIVAGNGRYLAARELGLKELPVIYQDFESSNAEYAFSVSDNAVAAWAELDLAGINEDLGDLGPDFDLELLGMKDFNVDPQFEPGSIEDQSKLDQSEPLITQCPNCGECFDAKENKPKN